MNWCIFTKWSHSHEICNSGTYMWRIQKKKKVEKGEDVVNYLKLVLQY